MKNVLLHVVKKIVPHWKWWKCIWMLLRICRLSCQSDCDTAQFSCNDIVLPCCDVAVASRLSSAILDTDASHWQKCLSFWRKLQTALYGPRSSCTVGCSRNDAASKPISHSSVSLINDLTHPSVIEKSSDDIGSRSAVKRPAADLVTFRVSAKCPSRMCSFNSQVGTISQSLNEVRDWMFVCCKTLNRSHVLNKCWVSIEVVSKPAPAPDKNGWGGLGRK